MTPHRRPSQPTARARLAVAAWLALVPATALAGTTGKLTGRVVDDHKQPLAGVTVTMVGPRLGAVTDLDGRYTILNIPAGTYDVKMSLLGYRGLTITKVSIPADLTTKQDAVLPEAPLPMQEVVVTGEKPVVEINLTSNIATVTSEQIKALPLQDLQDVVNLQAGVVDGHFRGGRLGEVQYQVDGVSVNNVFNNTSSLSLDRSLLEQVQVISGTFDAEYGQAMSGVVNAVLKRGSEKFTWNGEVYTGGFVYPGATQRVEPFEYHPAGYQNYQLSLSGPTGIPQTLYLVSGRYFINDDATYGTRTFLPTDSSNFVSKVFRPTGDGKSVRLGYLQGGSGVAKVSNRSFHNIELSYQAILESTVGQRSNWAFHLDPEGLTHQGNYSLVHGLDWTQTLSKTTFYTLTFRQNYLHYRDNVFDDAFDARYDDAGPPTGDPGYADGAFVQGVDFTRFEQRTNALVAKGSLLSQVTREHQIKVGAEYQWPKLEFGAPGQLVYTQQGGKNTLVRQNFGPIPVYWPQLGDAYAQDQIEWNDLTIRAGLRLDYFDANSTIPGDLANPANSITGAPPSLPKATSPKAYVSPRLGVSYPINPTAAIYFAYGHFYQMPPLGDIFSNSDYSVLKDLASGGITYGVMGNPDIRPERTVQYQMGYKQAINPKLGLDLNAFYKDIRDLLGVEFISTYNDAEYPRMTNVDFGNVIGLTVSLDQRPIGAFSAQLDYTWQMAQGNSSDPRETATRAEAGEDPRPRQVPLAWDQRNTLNLTVVYAKPDLYALSAITRLNSGQPFTPVIEPGFGEGLEANSGRKPASLVIDVRGERYFRWADQNLSLFGRIFNLFDADFNNGFVFASTGSVLYSRFPAQDAFALSDPTRFYGPRRIEVGLTFGGSW